jgi:alpha-1,2-mannosyltransferase
VDNGGVTSGPHRRPSRLSAWTLALVVLVAGALPPVLRYLVFWPQDQWQVDVEVYRRAGLSLLTGADLYAVLTEPPQLLAFTYPPFAAILAIPLGLLPLGVVAWGWTVAQVAATFGIVWLAAYRLLPWDSSDRARAWRPVVVAALTVPMLWLHPVADGIRFGQVNAFLVLACLADLRRPRPRWLRAVPPGMLVGLAMAVKLTPGVFLVHYVLCRRWREAGTAAATAGFVTAFSAVLLPRESWTFWLSALQDPARLGPNIGTSNQSLRGFLLRHGPEGTAGTALWLALVLVVAAVGFWAARELWRRGDSVGEVGVVGMMAVLLSPVAWIHHFHWVVIVILALVGPWPARPRWRLYAALAVTAWFLMRLPWWGISWLAADLPVPLFGRFMQNADLVAGLVIVGLLAALARLEQDRMPTDAGTESLDETTTAGSAEAKP